MYVDNEDVFYYLTLYNENYEQPAQPPGSTEGILNGLYRWDAGDDSLTTRATVLFSGAAQGAAREAQAELAERWNVGAELWSATSYKRLREEALTTERWNRLNPAAQPQVPLVTKLLAESAGPVVAVTDYVRAVPELISAFVPRPFVALGTDGYGRSDTREALRAFFETDAPSIVVAVLYQLAKTGIIERSVVAEAVAHYGLDQDAAPPWTR